MTSHLPRSARPATADEEHRSALAAANRQHPPDAAAAKRQHHPDAAAANWEQRPAPVAPRRELRSDARDNRDRIVEEARAAFAAGGLDVPMREIARRAGVGPATLYRHFPTKEALVAETFAEQMNACTAIVEEGLADPDPWRGFSHVLVRVCELHALDRGFSAAFVSAFPDAAGLSTARDHAVRTVAELVRRAKEAGELRPDFVLDDVPLILMANGGIRAASPAGTVAASRRFAALILRSLRVSSAPAPLPPAVRLPLTAHLT